MEKLILSVEGMTCAACTGRVERVLKAQAGVVDAVANLVTRRAEVTVSQLVDVAALALAVSKAGYAAAPLALAVKRDDEADQRGLWRQFWLAGLLTLPVFVVEMGGHLIPGFHMALHRVIAPQSLWLAEFVLVTLVLLGPGFGFFRKGIPALLRGGPDMNSLVAVGSGAAWAYSSVVTFAPGIIPEASRAVYFEAAAVIITLILLGRSLEARARGQAGAAIARLVKLAPKTARRLVDGAVQVVEVSALLPGDHVQIRPGERIPADGLVV
ncbi:MAG: copper-translocating P-type ATPase, partial [Cypionkella sp.]|uniref:cation transporter n=1 Tax=Cypionkella sp. TaxID=2811411 RepID=UPI00260B5750